MGYAEYIVAPNKASVEYTLIKNIVSGSFLASFLSACSLVYHTVEIRGAPPSLLTRGNVSSVVSEDENLPLVQNWASGDFAVVQISTNMDLIKLIRDKGANLSVESWFCSQPDMVARISLTGLYINGRNIVDWGLGLYEVGYLNNQKDQSDYVYEIVLIERWDKESSLPDAMKKTKSQSSYLKFDLRSGRDDVCLSISGGATIFSLIRSNTIVIPAEQLRRVFK